MHSLKKQKSPFTKRKEELDFTALFYAAIRETKTKMRINERRFPEAASASAAACLQRGRRADGFREQTAQPRKRKRNEGTTRQVGLADEGDQASKSPTLTRKNERRFERERQRGVKLPRSVSSKGRERGKRDGD